MSTAKNDARINVRLSSELKSLIEDAATLLGQSISEFTVATLVRESHQVIQDANVTELSIRDRDAFLEALDNAEPNEKLKAAARHYEKQILGDD